MVQGSRPANEGVVRSVGRVESSLNVGHLGQDRRAFEDHARGLLTSADRCGRLVETVGDCEDRRRCEREQAAVCASRH